MVLFPTFGPKSILHPSIRPKPPTDIKNTAGQFLGMLLFEEHTMPTSTVLQTYEENNMNFQPDGY